MHLIRIILAVVHKQGDPVSRSEEVGNVWGAWPYTPITLHFLWACSCIYSLPLDESICCRGLMVV